MKKIMILFISLLMMTGCATVSVYESQTGLPARNYELIISSPSNSGIKTLFHIAQTLEVSQESSIPVYLNLYQSYSLDGDKTKRVEMVLRVMNPKKEKYRVFKEVSYRESFGWDYQTSSQDIYTGNDIDKSFQLICPTKKGNYKVTTIVYSDDGIPLAMYNDFKYAVK